METLAEDDYTHSKCSEQYQNDRREYIGISTKNVP
jgi:hypothetical protein